jgi:hypothetical protein
VIRDGSNDISFLPSRLGSVLHGKSPFVCATIWTQLVTVRLAASHSFEVRFDKLARACRAANLGRRRDLLI